MTGVSLLLLCVIVMVHILDKESLFLWWVAAVVEVIFFIYGYLNMFDLLRDKLTWDRINQLELGLFVTNDIVESVSKGDVFFYLLHFFIRIVIATSRIVYLHGKNSNVKKEGQTEEKLSDYYRFSTVLKLFVYNHFPKLLLAFVVLISYVEEDAMSYILFILFLFNAFTFSCFDTYSQCCFQALAHIFNKRHYLIQFCVSTHRGGRANFYITTV